MLAVRTYSHALYMYRILISYPYIGGDSLSIIKNNYDQDSIKVVYFNVPFHMGVQPIPVFLMV